MKNRILSVCRRLIPYSPELKKFVGSTNACILMQQLDYYFEGKPHGFYKFIEPSEHPSYRIGDSWHEVLGFTAKEFGNAFERIGIRYKSKSEFDAAEDKFAGHFYCCYVDRRNGNLTWYFRNDQLVDRFLDEFSRNQERYIENEQLNPSPELHFGGSAASDQLAVPRNYQMAFLGNNQKAVLGNDQKEDHRSSLKSDLRSAQRENQYTKKTTKNLKTPTTKESTFDAAPDLKFPKVDKKTQDALYDRLRHIHDRSIQQDILDEIEGLRLKGELRSPIGLCDFLISDLKNFRLSAGLQAQLNRLNEKNLRNLETDRLASEKEDSDKYVKALILMSDEEFVNHCRRLPIGVKNRLKLFRNPTTCIGGESR